MEVSFIRILSKQRLQETLNIEWIKLMWRECKLAALSAIKYLINSPLYKIPL